jgi:hypothetical protein
MSTNRILPGLLAALLAGTAHAAPAPTTPAGYYVVVPMGPLRAATAAEGISVALSSATLPSGLVGIPYDGFNFMNLLTVTGDAGYTGYGVKWTLLSGSLPPGLTLGADGRLTGTPTANGTSTFQLRATYKTKNGDQAYQVVVGKIVVDLEAGAPPQAIVGQAYVYDLKPRLKVSGDSSYTGAGVTWTTVSSTLPAGLYLRNDGAIAGTPTVGGQGTLTARAAYRNAAGEQTYEVVSLAITVNLAGATPPQAIVGQAYSYDLKQHLAVNGDQAYTGSGVTWSTVSSTLPAGLALQADGTIAGNPTAAGSGTVTARATYRNVNGQQTYQVVTLNITVTLAPGTPQEAIVGQYYSYDLKSRLSVTGDGAYNGSGVEWTYVANSLPAGILLRTDGTISGTPTASGTGSVTARATYRGVNGQQVYQVVTLGINVSLAAGTPPQAIVGQSYSYDLKPLLTVSGDNSYNGSGVTWTVVDNSLPAGLTLLNNGTISGTPTAGGTGTITARASYRGERGDRQYQVVSLNIVVSLAAAIPPQARVGVAYNYDIKPQLTVSGDSAYTGSGVAWTATSNTLPAGLALTSAGAISGTPSVSGTGTVTARATYRNVNGQQSYSVTALPAWTYAWTPTSWSTPAACGSTTSTRSVTCVREDGTTVADASCTDAKPATTQAATDYSTCTYAWNSTGWSTPSACGSTTSTRAVYCQRSDGTTVADASCTGTKPASTQAATDYSSCTYSWASTGWSVPAACGSTTATRTVYCQRSDGTTVADASCTSAKPATSQPATDYSTCTYSNSYGTWGSCSASCGGGTQTRTATCMRSDGSAVSSANCPAPTTSQSCNTQSCYSYSWNYSGWSTPAACGATTSTRSVWCQRSDGTTMSDAYCAGTKPASSQAATDYSSCSYSFSYGTWGSCSASCGGGSQTRSATCYRSDGTAVANSSCGTPTTSQSCNTQSCYTYSWSYGGWSACSASCGGGTQTRSATCLRSDGAAMDGSYCGPAAATSASCNTQACSYTWQQTASQCTYNSEGSSLPQGSVAGQSCSSYGSTQVRAQNIGTSCGPGNYIKTTYTCQ